MMAHTLIPLFVKDRLLYMTIGYRLDQLIYLDFSIYNMDVFDSNCSIFDQIMALKWIKENIDDFGGNSNNITIVGESVGDYSELTLMVAPSAKGLFQKAICQSGYPDAFQSVFRLFKC